MTFAPFRSTSRATRALPAGSQAVSSRSPAGNPPPRSSWTGQEARLAEAWAERGFPLRACTCAQPFQGVPGRVAVTERGARRTIAPRWQLQTPAPQGRSAPRALGVHMGNCRVELSQQGRSQGEQAMKPLLLGLSRQGQENAMVQGKLAKRCGTQIRAISPRRVPTRRRGRARLRRAVAATTTTMATAASGRSAMTTAMPATVAGQGLVRRVLRPL